MRIFLASNSPRRKEILRKGNIDFTVVKSSYQEVPSKFYREDLIKKNSLNKALGALSNISENAVVIGADTMVILEEGMCDVCLLKPQNYNEAFLMLKKLSGRTHRVITSISLVESLSLRAMTETVETHVTFRMLEDNEISEYLEKFKPFDKAGSYGIQDFIGHDEAENPPATSFVENVKGDYYNVMGLSIDRLKDMLERFMDC